MRITSVATCSLNQWALDFDGNYQRITESIIHAKSLKASFRTGPELEICGYGCNDHFFEMDTFSHSWEVVCKLVTDARLHGIIIDIGLPVIHNSVRYNCRLVMFNGQIICIRPKLFLANDGNYRESRWFTPWIKGTKVEQFQLPVSVQSCTGQSQVPFGNVLVATKDAKIGFEMCEELFTPDSPNVYLGFEGVDIIANGSASHHELRKLKTRMDLLLNATRKSGGVYLYANQQGCDGERTYYDGCALVAMNGDLLCQGLQFSLDDIEVVVATVDLDEVTSYRSSISSRSMQAAHKVICHECIHIPIEICRASTRDVESPISNPISPLFLSPEEEIMLGPACWLWDYLRRSRMRGFFLPLSGGADSCATALIVSSMCRLIFAKLQCEDETTEEDVRRITGKIPNNLRELTESLFCTSYMSSKNSSKETRRRAKHLAEQIGSLHLESDIDGVVNSFLAEFTRVSGGKTPKYAVFGGTSIENLALQNVQARSRMVLSYLLAQLVPWSTGSSGGLLVLGSANVDECLRGYFTKYDCSSADLNPIGSISKTDLKRFITFYRDRYDFKVLDEFLNATPTAELEPLDNNHEQTDESDMGITYEELSVFGKLRKISRCGPVSAYQKLLSLWKGKFTPTQIMEKTKFFFKYYAMNRHKMTTITPAYHAESYSPDDNRFDLRPFLYRTDWKWQFEHMQTDTKD